MNKQTGAIFLIAGTCLGSGMMALPLVLSKMGLSFSLLFMVGMWGLMYGAALLTVELNLQAKKSMPIGALAQKFGGATTKLIGTLSLKVLSYALLSAFLYGATSILHELFPALEKDLILIGLGASFMIILSWTTPKIDIINRILFFILLGGLFLLIFLLLGLIEWQSLPVVPITCHSLISWSTFMPVVFTSFGFHGMVHTITAYCDNDKKMLKKAFFWGSLIPAIIYILWTLGVLGAIHSKNPVYYAYMTMGGADVGSLVREIASLTTIPFIKPMIWIGMILKFGLSIIGIGISLRDALSPLLLQRSANLNKWVLSALTILPPICIAKLVPNAFISVLGFAGMILAIIAILLPFYLLKHIDPKTYHLSILKNRFFTGFLAALGLLVILSEILNLVFRA